VRFEQPEVISLHIAKNSCMRLLPAKFLIPTAIGRRSGSSQNAETRWKRALGSSGGDRRAPCPVPSDWQES